MSDQCLGNAVAGIVNVGPELLSIRLTAASSVAAGTDGVCCAEAVRAKAVARTRLATRLATGPEYFFIELISYLSRRALSHHYGAVKIRTCDGFDPPEGRPTKS